METFRVVFALECLFPGSICFTNNRLSVDVEHMGTRNERDCYDATVHRISRVAQPRRRSLDLLHCTPIRFGSFCSRLLELNQPNANIESNRLRGVGEFISIYLSNSRYACDDMDTKRNCVTEHLGDLGVRFSLIPSVIGEHGRSFEKPRRFLYHSAFT